MSGSPTNTASAYTFLGRFLQHVLPKGFVKIRHYGLMASGNATTKLEIARRLLPSARPRKLRQDAATHDDAASLEHVPLSPTGFERGCCPVCGSHAVVRQPLPDAQARAPPVAA